MAKRRVIEVLGPGCPRCRQAERVVLEVVRGAGLDVEVRKVEAVDRMVELGVLATPALAVDGEVRIAGRVPSPEEVRRALGIPG